ncbi:hypothetical protein Ahy_B01g051777 [Arachis hypogaea]|uniref:Uncharacterized protein n=1 Tax=Arachis hypogaea TaxID=3818 RepID=A0A445AN12_ARAHY|nr:hypothetical protein Ahy_B01g051777 [Arachis hypogaea]
MEHGGVAERWCAVGSPSIATERFGLTGFRRFSTGLIEYMPMQKFLEDRACYQDSVQDLDMEDIDFDKMNLDAQEDDDDIEDW